MKQIVVLHGLSGVGKSTAQKYLASKYGCVSLHPIYPLFLYCHRYLGVPKPQSCDTSDDCFWVLTSQEFKAQVIPNTNMTVQEFLVSQWQYYRALGFPVSLNFMNTELTRLLGVPAPVSFGNLRNLHEVTFVTEFANTHKIPLVFVTIESDRGHQAPSDTGFEHISAKIIESGFPSYTVQNPSTDPGKMFTQLTEILGEQ